MILNNETNCPYCSGKLRHYDWVKRITKDKGGIKKFIFVERKQCRRCSKIHRVLPNVLYPHKHYLRCIIDGFISEQLSIFDLDFEDFPNEITIQRWKKSRVENLKKHSCNLQSLI